jgi:hypothetical protein
MVEAGGANLALSRDVYISFDHHVKGWRALHTSSVEQMRTLQLALPAACNTDAGGDAPGAVGREAVAVEHSLAALFDIVGDLDALLFRMEACHHRAMELAAAPSVAGAREGGSAVAPGEAAAASVMRLATERAQHGGLGYAAADVAQWLGARLAMYQDDFELKSAVLAKLAAAATAAALGGGSRSAATEHVGATTPGALLAMLIAWEASPHIDAAVEADIVRRMLLAEDGEAADET